MKKSSLKHLIKHVIRESVLTESMTLTVSGINGDDRTDKLLDLCFHLLRTCAYQILDNLPPDQQQYWRKNGLSYHDMLAPDGHSHFDQPTGVINFYIAGLTSQSQTKILRNIFAELRKLGIKWGKIVKEQSKMFKSPVVRIPIVSNNQKYSGPPELNMSNSNAYHIFHNVLGFEPADKHNSSFSFTVQEVEDAIIAAFQDKGWLDKNIRQDYDSHDPNSKKPESDNPHDEIINQIVSQLGNSGEETGDEWKGEEPDPLKGPRIMSFGLNKDDIAYRLGEILKVAKWAKEHGHTQLYVG
jgi:hypothetical protein